jgi:hypothetical protein
MRALAVASMRKEPSKKESEMMDSEDAPMSSHLFRIVLLAATIIDRRIVVNLTSKN